MNRVVFSALFVLVGVCAANAAITIDDFTTGQGPLSLTAPGDIGATTSSVASGGGILGTERDIEVELIGSTVNGNGIQVVVATYNHSQDGGVTGRSTVTWDGIDGDGSTLDPTGLGGVDLTQAGTQDALEIELVSADLGATLIFDVFTDGANASSLTLNFPGGALNAIYVLPYATFTTTLGAGADFSNVGAIAMTVDGSTVQALDVIVDFLGTTSVLTAEKTDALLIDNDADGFVDVGDTIRYTIVITNPDDDGDATAPAVVFTDTPDGNTNLVVGSVTTSQGSVTTGNTGGDTTVEVDVGDIPDGGTVTITFDVDIKAPPLVCNQGFAGTLPTDDPDDPTSDSDPTCTPVTFCGDGAINDPLEECDDGNNINGDGCDENCINEICGNGVLQAGEECDDGNNINGDGCDENCINEVCGNGVLQSGEECDDGNNINGDGCDENCVNEICGNGVLQAGEECDDGNNIDGDGCDANCVNEICGNGVLQAGEECDDGNNVNGDGCDENCVNEICGNGVLQAGEECDDGNNIDGDGCDANCVNEICGNGILQAGEQCDDGNNINGDGCDANCRQEICGNGILQSGEECDDGNNVNGDGCDENCRRETPTGEIPATSQWGILVLTLLLATLGKVYFGRQRRVAGS